LSWLYGFFEKASKLNAVSENAVSNLLGQVTLNTQPAAACLALIAKNSSAHKKLLDTFI